MSARQMKVMDVHVMKDIDCILYWISNGKLNRLTSHVFIQFIEWNLLFTIRTYGHLYTIGISGSRPRNVVLLDLHWTRSTALSLLLCSLSTSSFFSPFTNSSFFFSLLLSLSPGS